MSESITVLSHFSSTVDNLFHGVDLSVPLLTYLLTYLHYDDVQYLARPVESHSGARENITWGPITPPLFCMS